MSRWAVILAGGSGQRLWPLTGVSHPKPLLPLVNGRSLLELTLSRMTRLVPRDRIRILCTDAQARLIRRQLAVPAGRFLIEPDQQNTAACVGLAAACLQRLDPLAVCLLTPADHWIPQQTQCLRTCRSAFASAEQGNITLVGIHPAHASDQYGYIKRAGVHAGVKQGPRKGEREQGTAKAAYAVERFVEKPTTAQAARWLNSSAWFWNSGVVCGRADALLRALTTHVPSCAAAARRLAQSATRQDWGRRLRRFYDVMPTISFDHAVLQRERALAMVIGRFQWSDLGTWPALESLHKPTRQRNRIQGDSVLHATTDSTVINTTGRPLAVCGVRDAIIVQTERGTLVCRRHHVGDIRRVAQHLDRRRGPSSSTPRRRRLRRTP